MPVQPVAGRRAVRIVEHQHQVENAPRDVTHHRSRVSEARRVRECLRRLAHCVRRQADGARGRVGSGSGRGGCGCGGGGEGRGTERRRVGGELAEHGNEQGVRAFDEDVREARLLWQRTRGHLGGRLLGGRSLKELLEVAREVLPVGALAQLLARRPPERECTAEDLHDRAHWRGRDTRQVLSIGLSPPKQLRERQPKQSLERPPLCGRALGDG